MAECILGDDVVYVQISRVKISQGRIAEAVELFRESVLPVVQDQPGFIKFYLLSHPDEDELVVENFWESAEDIEALQISGFYQQQVKKFGTVFASSPHREIYAVVLEA